jgi:hypothetical protein
MKLFFFFFIIGIDKHNVCDAANRNGGKNNATGDALSNRDVLFNKDNVAHRVK